MKFKKLIGNLRNQIPFQSFEIQKIKEKGEKENVYS